MPEPSAPPPGPRVRLPPALPADGLPGYAELHGLSNFSFLRGASHPEELVERAYQLGYAALAITDECSVAGVVRAWAAWRDLQALLTTELLDTLDARLAGRAEASGDAATA